MTFLNRHQKLISKIGTIALFLALIRTLAEPFRLEHYASTKIITEQLKPFLIGALISASGLIVITILSYYNKYKLIIFVALITIISLFITKYIFHL